MTYFTLQGFQRDSHGVTSIGYLTTLVKADLDSEFNYSERSIVEKLFQSDTMRIGRFHETWNGSQLALSAG